MRMLRAVRVLSCVIAIAMPWVGRAAVSNVPGFVSFELESPASAKRAVEFVNDTIFVVANPGGVACNETVYRIVDGAGFAIATGFGAIEGMVYDAVNDRMLVAEATQSCSGPGNTILQIPSPFTTPSTVPSNTTVPSPFSIPNTPSGIIPGLVDIAMDLTDSAGQRVIVSQNSGVLQRVSRVLLTSQTLVTLVDVSGGTVTGVAATPNKVYYGKLTSGGNPVGQIHTFDITATTSGQSSLVATNRPGQSDLDLEADGTIVSSEFSATTGDSRIARIHPTSGDLIGIAGAGIGAPTEVATNAADGSSVVVDFDATPTLLVFKPTECNDGKDNNSNGWVDLDFCASPSTPTEELAFEIASDHQYTVEGSPENYRLRRYSLTNGAQIGDHLLTRFLFPDPGPNVPEYQMPNVTDMAVNKQGQILVADAGEAPETVVNNSATGLDGAVYLVDAKDGGILQVSDSFFNPAAVAADADGSFILFDSGGFNGGNFTVSLCRYDPSVAAPGDCNSSLTNAFSHLYSTPTPARVAASPTTGKIYLLTDSSGVGSSAKVNRFTSALVLDGVTPVYQQQSNGPLIHDLEVTRGGRVLVVECSGSGGSEVCDLREIDNGSPTGTLVKSNIGGRDVEEITNGNLRIRPSSGFFSELNLTTLAIASTSIPAASSAVAAAVQIAQCADKIDNNGAGGIDFPTDSANCVSATDELEATLAGGLDNDGVPDYLDNCSLTVNGQVALPSSLQLDTDLDGFGNACDADYDNDGATTTADFGLFLSCFGVPGPITPACREADSDGNEAVQSSDFGTFLAYFSWSGRPPGPSALKCANATATGPVCP